MYTITYGTHKGWQAIAGAIIAIGSAAIPLASSGMFGPKVGAIGVALGALIAAFSSKPGALDAPVVTASLPSEVARVNTANPSAK